MKRYSPHVVGSITFCETDDGEWVKRSDYDALANSGALVPVPDGEPCKLMDCTAHCFIHDGELFTISTRSGDWWVSTHTPRQDDADSLESFHFTTIVQPVLLVSIAEWEAEG